MLKIIIIFIALSGCVTKPEFETTYEYSVLESKKTNQCINICNNLNTSCTKSENNLELQARMQAIVDFNNCQKPQFIQHKPSSSNNYFCNSSTSYMSNHSKCINNFNACYQTCGGKILSKKVCVSNCTK